MGRRQGAAGGAALVLCLHLVVSLRTAAAAGPDVANACQDIQCFSGVIAACGSCLPTTSAGFCKSPCQASWGGLDTITCLGQAGNTYWLNNVQSLNVNCGLPPIPAAGASASTAAGGGLGAVAAAPAPAAAAATSATPVVVTGGTSGSLSGVPTAAPTLPLTATGATGAGSPAATSAAAATSATAAGATGTTATGSPGLSDTASVSTIPATTAASAASTAGSTVATGAAGSGGTAASNGTDLSSAIAAFGCISASTQLNLATASGCVTSVTSSNQCTQSCQAQFALLVPACRNTMVQDQFYGKTWQGVFKACSVSASTSGPVVANQEAANLAAGPTVATAATQGSTLSSSSDPLLSAAAPTDMQGAFSTLAVSAPSLLAAVAAVLLTL